MNRRNFIKNISLGSLSIPLISSGIPMEAFGQTFFNVPPFAEDRVLVLIKLGGGNDGLSTVIPRAQYANLVIQRPSIILPESTIIPVTDNLGFHPVMTEMKTMFEENKLSIIQNVGYDNQNRSHFRSSDIWNIGMTDPSITSGWMGRFLDYKFPNYPQEGLEHPFAISLGYDVSPVCQGDSANFCYTLSNLDEPFNLINTEEVNDGTYYGDHLEYISVLINQTNVYGEKVHNAALAGANASTYNEANKAALYLKYVAKLISGGLKTKVFIVNIDGFDTHDNQVVNTDVVTGEHADLLKQLSEAIQSFQNDIDAQGLSHRVLGMTYSEFGRQVAENGSYGTDHGDAAPMFLFGSCMNQKIMGNTPIIKEEIIDQEGVPLEYDFRDIYASILKDWFVVPPEQVQSFFDKEIKFYPIVDRCNPLYDSTATIDSELNVYPNPAVNTINIKFKAMNEDVYIQVIDIHGKIALNPLSYTASEGLQKVPIDISALASGNYTVTVTKASGTKKAKFIKTK